MKLFPVLTFYSVFLRCNIEAGGTRWSLLRQSDYDVKIEIARVDSFNRSYFNHFKLDAVPYNRTYRVLNASFEFNVNLNKQMMCGVQLYKFLSNEYRFFPLTLEFDVCTEYNHDSFGMKHLFDHVSNFNPCIIEKDLHYRLNKAIPDFSKFPPHIPFGRYRANLDLLDKSNRGLMARIVVDLECKGKPINYE